MNTLPPELLRNICDNFQDKKATLKAVRLVSRILANVAAPLLFQTLLVYQTPKSWNNLSSIAQCEWLAPHVVRLEVAVLKYLPHYLDFVDWKRLTWRYRWDCFEKQKNRAGMVSLLVEKQVTHLPLYTSNPNGVMRFSDWKQCPEVRSWNERHDQSVAENMLSELGEEFVTTLPAMDSALGLVYRYQRYRYWNDGENELSDSLSHSESSHLDLIPFPNLRTMSVLESHELWKHASWPLAKANRKVREAAEPMCLEMYRRVVPRNVHLNLTLRTLATSAVNITRLELHRYGQILANPAFPVPPLKHLQELILKFPYHDNYLQTYHNRLEPWKVAPWLRVADDLHTLIVLSQDPKGHGERRGHNPFFDVIALLHGIEWPKLRFIHFKETFISSLQWDCVLVGIIKTAIYPHQGGAFALHCPAYSPKS